MRYVARIASVAGIAAQAFWPGIVWGQEFKAEDLFNGQDIGSLKVRIGNSRALLPAAPFGCARCHGSDATGGGEGATRAPPIDWPNLSVATKQRPAYTRESFVTAVTEGRSSSGIPLDRAMPRYQLDGELARSLAAYLEQLPSFERAGIGPQTIQVIVPFRPVARKLAQGFVTGFDEAIGGRVFWGRRLELTLCEVDKLGKLPSSCGVPFAVAGSTVESDPAGNGTIDFAPLTPTAEKRPSKYRRSIRVSDEVALAAIVRRIDPRSPGVAVVAPDNQAANEATALVQKVIGDRQPIRRFEKVSDAPGQWSIVLLDTARQVETSQTGAPIYGIADQIGQHLPDLVLHGHTISLVDPYPKLPDIPGHVDASRVERIGFVAGTIMGEALQRAGRGVTRARFLAAMASSPIRVGDLSFEYARNGDVTSIEPTTIEFRSETR